MAIAIVTLVQLFVIILYSNYSYNTWGTTAQVKHLHCFLYLVQWIIFYTFPDDAVSESLKLKE